jgi:hypothetical protein
LSSYVIQVRTEANMWMFFRIATGVTA